MVMLPPKTTPSPALRRQSLRGQYTSTPKPSNIPGSPSLSLPAASSSMSSFTNIRRSSSYTRQRSNSITSTSSSHSNSNSNTNSNSASTSTPLSIAKKRFLSPSIVSSMDTHANKQHQPYTGSITVTVRIKPVSESVPQWNPLGDRKVSHPDHGEFNFDHVFGPQCDNLLLFQTIGTDLITKLFDGFNATLFAYGMTGSGKTYTMLGEGNHNIGVVELCGSYMFSRIFNAISDSQDYKYDVMVSYLEIYNEKIYDLLDTAKRNDELKLRDDSINGIRVVGLAERRCQDSNELMKWVRMGEMSRKTGKTDYNTRSSRSHAIIQIKLTSTSLQDGCMKSNTLSLCDLAGSERATGQAERRKEGSFINKSLLALGTVISKLSAESVANVPITSPTSTSSSTSSSSSSISGSVPTGNNNTSHSHIPYRDSKLTRLLQPALSGNSVVATICTIDPRKDASAETINTLRFASRAKNISLNVARKPISYRADSSELEKDRKIKELSHLLEEQEKMINDLKRQQQQLQSPPSNTLRSPSFTPNNPTASFLEAENRVLKSKLVNYEKLLDRDNIELQDSAIFDIVEMLPMEVGTLLESKVQGLESEIRQYKGYSEELEQKILKLERGDLSPTGHATSSNNLEAIIKEKETKIEELHQMLQRKDKMIDALQSTKRIRDRALKPIANQTEQIYSPMNTPSKRADIRS